MKRKILCLLCTVVLLLATAGCSGQQSGEITFAVFSDFHYNPNNTLTGIADLQAVLDRAHEADADFVMSLGDFHNDAIRSPELFKTYHGNTYGLPVYNIYGNHELEGYGNSMEVVTPTLTNDENVVWGSADGEMDTAIGYYYFDKKGFRMICLDNNYYTDPQGEWHHNPTNSYGCPDSAVTNSCLGPTQLAWLRTVLEDAADRGLSCIINVHIPLDGVYGAGGDAAEARALFAEINARRAGTVMLVLCGHAHMDRHAVVDGILYKYINVTRGCCSDRSVVGTDRVPYRGKTFLYEVYNDEGELTDSYERPITGLNFNFSYYSAEAMSTLITVSRDGTVTLEGCESTWLYGEAPQRSLPEGVGPKHASFVYTPSGEQ